jgi:signal transduction histidine kinase
LKTPVASILGYTDTILQNPDMSEEQQKKFIERTNIQAQRLTALLQDISTLNKMDYAADRLTRERVNISELVSDIVEETQLALERQQMTLHNCLPEDICVNGNTAMLYSIFRNLTDNAVNYAGTGTVIEISAQPNGKYWDFTFSDNGNGVPPEHLPRLFERFYRLDKGRSRSMGGTGLGLAIVKNAVLLHGGSITVENAPQGGLCFHFSIKR